MTRPGSAAVMAGLAVVGLAISGYLTWVHYEGIEPLCTGISDCARVQASAYSEWLGIPVALLGMAAYAAILASLALRGDAGLLAGAFLALVGAGFSAYLTWLEAARIEAWCQWCVVSAVLMLALVVVSWRRLSARAAATTRGRAVEHGRSASG